ncbi:Asp23/Gls24 family envelope stress response protein [Myceligenerans cantabricum]
MTEFINSIFHRPEGESAPEGHDLAEARADSPDAVATADAETTSTTGSETSTTETDAVDDTLEPLTTEDAGLEDTEAGGSDAEGTYTETSDTEGDADTAAEDDTAADAVGTEEEKAEDSDTPTEATGEATDSAPATEDEPAATDDIIAADGPPAATDDIVATPDEDSPTHDAVPAGGRPEPGSRGSTTLGDGLAAKVVRSVVLSAEGVHDLDDAPSAEIVDDVATISVSIVAAYGSPVKAVATQIRTDVIEAVENYLDVEVEAVHVTVSDIHVP